MQREGNTDNNNKSVPHSEEGEAYPALQNDLLIRAALGQPTERVPVWIMRQAGRYLPEYNAVKVSKDGGIEDFFSICRTKELAAKITLQPIERFPSLDAAIIFSDILVIPQAMGMQVVMLKGEGTVVYLCLYIYICISFY